ncbi:MAG: T9SS type A sorting domain-containing protein [Bacteroidales bacterium]|jgi:hypothetical protein
MINFRTSALAIIFLITALTSRAQYPPAAGQVGSTAIRNDSSIIVAWASHCEVFRGPVDIANPGGGSASFGNPDDATGFAEGNPSQVISLGDGGSAIMTFDGKIFNGPGPDFAVFENSFSDDFLELAFVEVSSNGIDFFRFPSVSLTDTTIQVSSFGKLDPTKIHNLAGKYRAGYGTPFDLEDLQGIAGLDVNAITHVKIIDVIGCIQPEFAMRDSEGRIINDPWPTPFSSSGFDLDGVGVIHLSSIGVMDVSAYNPILYNPISHCISLSQSPSKPWKAEIYSINGQKLGCFSSENQYICLPALKRGLYLIKVSYEMSTQTLKIFAN